MFYIFFACVLIFLCGSVQPISRTPDEALQKLVALNNELDQATPMQMSVRSLKGLFAEKTGSTLELRGRPDSFQSKTSLFNKSFLKYIKEIYNDRGYAEVLSQNGTHIVEFLELSSELNLDIDTVYVCMRLFYNKMKAAELVDETMLNHVLPYFHKYLDRFFSQKDDDKNVLDLNLIQKNIETIILTKFTEGLPEFQQKPDAFVTLVASEIVALVQQESSRVEKLLEKNETKERLRQVVIRFLECTVNKAIWNPRVPEGIWQSFLSIANNLQLFGAYDMITHMDDLDDVLWSLVHRFCFFLDLTGSILPMAFFEEVEHDLANGLVFFLESKEQDAGIKSKKECLAEALIQAKTRAVAYYKNGIFSQPF